MQMNYKNRFCHCEKASQVVIALSFALISILTSSCSDSQQKATDKQLPELLGAGTTIRIEPAEVWRERPEDFTMTIMLGKAGLPANESIGIINGSYIDRWKFDFPSHQWGSHVPWQAEDKSSANFVSAMCSRKGVSLTLKVGESGPLKPFVNTPNHFVRSVRERFRYVLELSSEKDLQEGDIIRIQWKQVSPPAYAMRYFFLPFQFSKLPDTDRDLPIRTGDFHNLPGIRVKGHSAEYLHVTCGPIHSINETFSLNIAAIDKYGNLAEDFTGTVRLIADFDNNFPSSVEFFKEDRGCKLIDHLSINEAGWYRIKAESGSISGRSNYLVVSNKEPKQRLYFGDMHTHTLDCDGTNDMLEHFFYAPKVAGLDFGSVSCHAEYFGCKKAWDRYLKETSKANKPGEFVTFYGYEWAQEGHTNAYFLSEEDAMLVFGEKRMRKKGYPEDNPQFRTGAGNEIEFMEILGNLKQPVFTIAHVHSAYNNLNDTIHWLDEIYSCHKHDRKIRENRLRENLQKGLRLGVVAGSDMHRLTMGHLCKEPGLLWPVDSGCVTCQYQTAGLQAIFASDLTREDLYAGMKDRCTYGTSGARIVLLFSCNESPMGSNIRLPNNDSPTFNIEVGGTSELSEVALCRFDGELWSEPIQLAVKETERYTGSWEDKEFKGTGIYYVRITQKDGEQAWSSPVWINK